MSGRTVVKVGGSLCGDPVRLRALLGALAEGAFGPCLVVPGGGVFADEVRAAQIQDGFDDAEAHRRALDAMGRMAAQFHAIEPRLLPAPLSRLSARATLPRRGGRDDPRSASTETRSLIWDPAALRAGHPDIPESWDVTSDSLALWVATEIRAARCVLVKSADAPVGADARDLARHGLVDAAFPAFAARYGGEIAILGPAGERKVHARAAA